MTGEEEYWSHTDLYDFQANVDGARVAWQDLEPVLEKRNPTLNSQITLGSPHCRSCWMRRSSAMAGSSTDRVSKTDVRQLSDAVNALAEPVSKMAAAVL